MEDYNEFKSSAGTKVVEMMVAGAVLTVVSVLAVGAFVLVVGIP